MAHRSPARILAPLALVGAVVATIVVVGASTSGSGGSSTSTTTTQSRDDRRAATDGGSRTQPAAPSKPRARAYTVKPGDILSTVSERTGVSIERLQELNPDLDPQALQVGQRIKLAADAATDQTP